MPPDGRPTNAPGVVLVYFAGGQEAQSEHERRTLLAFARQLAALRGEAMAGIHDPNARPAGHVYFVPDCTLTREEAEAIGVHCIEDLFGGVVPHRFVGGKAISHPLVDAAAASVPGWNAQLATEIAEAVLDGYSAFSHEDARRAGLRLLEQGPVRIKPVRASGGHGQSVIGDAAGLQQALAAMAAEELAAHGVVLEQDLQDAQTFSIGQVQVAELTASYFGVQRLTQDNRGQTVFGGSELTVVRGGFEDVLARELPPAAREALALAQRYDAAVHAHYPGFFASRRNYDVIRGRDASGRARCGVLEQSWRVGGATGPELAALEIFRREPQRNCVRTACVEIFGDSREPPPGATVYFRGADPLLGPLTKYTYVQEDVDTL